MALLQIAEPGMSPDPHQRRVAVGIDLGTTHSLVAAVRSGAVDVLADEDGRVLLPSAVRYAAGEPTVVGRAALDRLQSTEASFRASPTAFRRHRQLICKIHLNRCGFRSDGRSLVDAL